MVGGRPRRMFEVQQSRAADVYWIERMACQGGLEKPTARLRLACTYRSLVAFEMEKTDDLCFYGGFCAVNSFMASRLVDVSVCSDVCMEWRVWRVIF